MATPKERAAGHRGAYLTNTSPSLARTQTKAIIRWPWLGGRKRRVEVANTIRRALPQYQFNSRQNWHEAPLTEENLRAAADIWPDASWSRGVTEMLDPDAAEELKKLDEAQNAEWFQKLMNPKKGNQP